MTEENQYDEIFTALKHPVRRQILLFIDSKGEASFTDIQQNTGITDTGLMSYHLKELTALVEQSKRGKYKLSEVGQAGVELFRKVDRERERSNKVIHEEIERFIGLSIKKSILFLLIAGLTFLVPMYLDSYFYVRLMVQGYSLETTTGIFLITLTVMVVGAFLFTLFDRHYEAKTTKSNIIHSLLFTFCGALLSVWVFNSMYTFALGTSWDQMHIINSIPWVFEILRVTIFIASAPLFAYILSKRSNCKK